MTLTCICSRWDQESLLWPLRPPTSNRGNIVFLEATGRSGLGSGERDLPSLCVRTQFTGADDQHARRVHPIQSHLRVQAEPGDQVLQVGPRFLPTLEAKHRSHLQLRNHLHEVCFILKPLFEPVLKVTDRVPEPLRSKCHYNQPPTDGAITQ